MKPFLMDNAFAEKIIARRKEAKPRRPLRTFREMAEEFGVTAGQLRGAFAKSPHPHPQPQLVQHSAFTHNSYYDPAEMRAWWRLHTDSQ